MSIVAIIVSVISASYYLKIVRVLFTEPEEGDSLYTSSQTSDHLNQSNLYSIENKNNLINNPSVNNQIEESFNCEADEYIINQSKINNFHSFLISLLTLTILLFILKPSIFLNSIQLLCLSLYNC